MTPSESAQCLCVRNDAGNCIDCGISLNGKEKLLRYCLARCPQLAVPHNETQGLHASLSAGDALRVHGPGAELSKLLKRFGIEPTPTCACRAKAAEMDAWGCDEASKPERIDEVVAVMRAEAQARGLPFLDVAGRLLVRRAIANARRRA
jgi:hypothetical protein